MTKAQQNRQDRKDREKVYASDWWLKSDLYHKLRYEHGYEKIPRREEDEWQKWRKIEPPKQIA